MQYLVQATTKLASKWTNESNRTWYGNQILLPKQRRSLPEQPRRVVMFCSPEVATDENLPWNAFVPSEMASRGAASIAGVDELHMVHFKGFTIRDSFLHLEKNLFKALLWVFLWVYYSDHDTSNHDCDYESMADTLPCHQSSCALGPATPREMSKQHVKIDMIALSEYGFVSQFKQNIMGRQLIIYTNRRSRMGRLTECLGEAQQEA